VYVGLCVADVTTTAYAIAELGLTEANPILARVVATHGVLGLTTLKLANLLGVGLIWAAVERHRTACLAVVVTIEAAIVANTSGVILVLEGVL
jgi:hypothetical protein